MSRWLIDYCGFGRYRNHSANPRIASVDISSLLLEHIFQIRLLRSNGADFAPAVGNRGLVTARESVRVPRLSTVAMQAPQVSRTTPSGFLRHAFRRRCNASDARLKSREASSRIRGTKPSFTFATKMNSLFS